VRGKGGGEESWGILRGCQSVCEVEEVRCGRRKERIVERILAEEDKEVLYRSETRRVDTLTRSYSEKESQATDACSCSTDKSECRYFTTVHHQR